MLREVFSPVHGTAFLVAFGFVSAIAVLAFVLDLAKIAWSRAAAVAALVLLGVALALACTDVVSWRAGTDEMLGPRSSSTACEKTMRRREGYGEARETASVALRGAPLALLVATFVAARTLRRGAAFGWAVAPWALLGAVGYLYAQPLPGPRRSIARCELYRERDTIFGSDGVVVRRSCLFLSETLNDPRAMAAALDGEREESAIPELPAMKRRCLDDLLEWCHTGGPDSFSRRDILASPFVMPEDVPEVQRVLDEIASQKPVNAGRDRWGESPFDGGLP